jgi:hypothetical protein
MSKQDGLIGSRLTDGGGRAAAFHRLNQSLKKAVLPHPLS